MTAHDDLRRALEREAQARLAYRNARAVMATEAREEELEQAEASGASYTRHMNLRSRLVVDPTLQELEREWEAARIDLVMLVIEAGLNVDKLVPSPGLIVVGLD